MNRRQLLKGLGAVAVASGLNAKAFALGEGFQENFKALDPKVEELLKAYNAKSWKKFYVGWADQMKALQTEQVFNALYINQAHPKFGAYKSRTVIEGQSVFNDVTGLLVYDAVFAKGKALLSVNFFKENGQYKFQQVRIDPPA